MRSRSRQVSEMEYIEKKKKVEVDSTKEYT